MDEIPKANVIQTGRNFQQSLDSEGENQEMPVIDDNENFQTPSFVNDLMKNGNNYGDLEESPNFQQQNSNSQQNNYIKKKSYNITSLFWIVNEGLWNRDYQMGPYEAHFVTIAHNLDFGNLKINYYTIPNGAIDGNIVFEQSLQRMISGTIYPSSCFHAMNISEGNITCMEQLIKKTGEQWEKERPYVIINKTKQSIMVKIIDVKTNNVYWFSFEDWKKSAFEYCLRYAYTEGFKTQSLCNAMKNLF